MREGDYYVKFTNRFEQQNKKLLRSGRENLLKKLNFTISLLTQGGELPPSYRNHRLVGRLEGFYECRVSPDWLLLYFRRETEKEIVLVSMGSHADLFG